MLLHFHVVMVMHHFIFNVMFNLLLADCACSDKILSLSIALCSLSFLNKNSLFHSFVVQWQEVVILEKSHDL